MRLAPLIVCAVAVAGSSLATAAAASADRFFLVRLADGSLVTVRAVDVPADVPMDRVSGLPGVPLEELDTPRPGTPVVELADDAGTAPAADGEGRPQTRVRSPERTRPGRAPPTGGRSAGRVRRRDGPARGRRGGSPPTRRHSRRGRARARPFDGLPGPSRTVSDLAISRFRMPIFLLPLYTRYRDAADRWRLCSKSTAESRHLQRAAASSVSAAIMQSA
jgi:hypothetical protein